MIELLFYRPNGSISRREICRPDRRDGRRFDLDEKGKKTAEGPIRGGLPEGEWQFYTPEGKLKAESRMTAGKMTGPQTLFGDDGKPRASNTLLELVRQKVFYFLLLFALVSIGSNTFSGSLSNIRGYSVTNAGALRQRSADQATKDADQDVGEAATRRATANQR
jgi:hypothetical protein